MNKIRGKEDTGKAKIRVKEKTKAEEDHKVKIGNQSHVFITFRKVDVLRVRTVPLVTQRGKHPVVPVLDPGMEREETQRMIEHLPQSQRVRNLASYMPREDVIAQIVLTNMTAKQLLSKMNQQKQKRRLPKGRPKLQRPKPKVRR